MSPFHRAHTTSYGRCIVSMVLSCVVYDIQCWKILWPWNPGQRWLKVIKNDTIRSGTHDFLLTFHSNHRRILHCFRDKRRFKSKIAIFPPPIYFAPLLTGSLWNCLPALGQKKTMMGLPDGQKKFQDRFSLLDTIPAYDNQPRCDNNSRTMHYTHLAVETERWFVCGDILTGALHIL